MELIKILEKQWSIANALSNEAFMMGDLRGFHEAQRSVSLIEEQIRVRMGA